MVAPLLVVVAHLPSANATLNMRCTRALAHSADTVTGSNIEYLYSQLTTIVAIWRHAQQLDIVTDEIKRIGQEAFDELRRLRRLTRQQTNFMDFDQEHEKARKDLVNIHRLMSGQGILSEPTPQHIFEETGVPDIIDYQTPEPDSA